MGARLAGCEARQGVFGPCLAYYNRNTRRNTPCYVQQRGATKPVAQAGMGRPGCAPVGETGVTRREHTRSGMRLGTHVAENARECGSSVHWHTTAASCVRCENQSPRRRSGTTKPGAQAKGNGRRRTRRRGAATATEWRRVREVVKAVVSSTLTEAMAVALTQVQGVVRKPVTGEPAPGDAEREAAVPRTSAASRTARARRSRRRRRAEPTPDGFEVNRCSGRVAAWFWT